MYLFQGVPFYVCAFYWYCHEEIITNKRYEHFFLRLGCFTFANGLLCILNCVRLFCLCSHVDHAKRTVDTKQCWLWLFPTPSLGAISLFWLFLWCSQFLFYFSSFSCPVQFVVLRRVKVCTRYCWCMMSLVYFPRDSGQEGRKRIKNVIILLSSSKSRAKGGKWPDIGFRLVVWWINRVMQQTGQHTERENKGKQRKWL